MFHGTINHMLTNNYPSLMLSATSFYSNQSAVSHVVTDSVRYWFVLLPLVVCFCCDEGLALQTRLSDDCSARKEDNGVHGGRF